VRRRAILSSLVCAVLAAALAGTQLLAADPAAAERQFRIARRLIAERSPEAVAALQKVLELDPQGVLADDALVEQALLLGIPRWPEETGRMELEPARQAQELLTRVTDEFSLADRAPEARYLRALLRLEPLPFHDASDARLELVTVATARNALPWSRIARYALGWVAEQEGKDARALEAYQRIVVDAPESETAPRAEVGLARLQLREGRPGEAAAGLQAAIDREVPPQLRAEALRELAVRAVLLRSGAGRPAGTAAPLASSTGVRDLVGMVATPDGGVLVAGRKLAAVLRYDSAGEVVGRWSLEDLQALAVDPRGLAFAAAGDTIHLLERERPPRPVASLGEFMPVTALAVDGLGGFWVLDRRGERVGRVAPGSGQAVPVGPVQRARLEALAWDGRRLLALNARDKNVVSVDAEGRLEVVAGRGLLKPQALAAAPDGSLAVLDGRADEVLRFDSRGEPLGSVSWAGAGIARAETISVAWDGALLFFDGSTQRCVRVP
jgi:tetratricopeptide (TPR) repeat protein